MRTRLAGRILPLSVLVAAAAGGAAWAAGGAMLTPQHQAQVRRFASDALGVETKLDGYSEVWNTVPQGASACGIAVGRPAFSKLVRDTANSSIGFVKTAERGELTLYAYSRDLSRKRYKNLYVKALDLVGTDFDHQLADGRQGLQIAAMIKGGQCAAAMSSARRLSNAWGKHLAEVRKDVGKLHLAWGV